MIVVMCIGLYTSRIVLNKLGVVDFGIFNVVGSAVALFDFIKGSLSSGCLRFLTIEMGKGNNGKVHDVFSTSFIIHLLFSLVVFFLAETLGRWLLLNELTLPAERQDAALLTFHVIIITSIMGLMSMPFYSLIIAEERMTIFAYISIFDVIAKLGIAFLIGIGGYDKLVLYSFLLLLAQIVVTIIYLLSVWEFLNETRFLHKFDGTLFASILKFSFWTINGSLAMMGVYQGIDILLNIFFGPIVNAARGIAIQVQSKISSFCDSFQTAVRPQINKLYASGNIDEMAQLVIFCSKLSFFLVYVLSLPIIINTRSILYYWLGIVPDYSSGFVILMLVSGIIRALANPLTFAVHATGNIKCYQIYEGGSLLTVVPAAFLLLKYCDITPIHVLLVYLVIEFLTQLVRIRIVLPLIGVSYPAYFKNVVLPILYVIMSSSLIIFLFKFAFRTQSFLSFTISFFFCLVISIFCVYSLGCNVNEKGYLRNYISDFIKKK